RGPVAAAVAGVTVVATVATTQRPRTGGSKRAPKKKAAPPPSLLDRLTRLLGQAVDGHGADLAGLLCIALGLVAALGTYVGAAGPVGRVLDDGIGTLVGWGRMLAPPALVVAGVLLVRGPREGEEGGARSHIWVGGLLIAVAG